MLLALEKAMGTANVRTQGTIYFVANVGEEGPGNLRGVKHLLAKPPAKSTTSSRLMAPGLA